MKRDEWGNVKRCEEKRRDVKEKAGGKNASGETMTKKNP
jgi:uncharacterized protein YdaU (DUF1376 family)